MSLVESGVLNTIKRVRRDNEPEVIGVPDGVMDSKL